MSDADVPLDDILVVVAHPHGDIEVPLRTWITVGPGPRELVTIGRARHRVTGATLPLTVVPLEYRNDEESRRLIREGKIVDPWPRSKPAV